MIETGTRTRANRLTIALPGGSMTRSLNNDPGLSKRVIVSVTFGSGRLTAANGTFAAFAGGEVLQVEDVNLNNGYFNVTGIDVTNQAYLVVSPPPKAEGPITATVRTS